MSEQLTEEQLDLLMAAREIGYENAIVLDESTYDRTRDLLGDVLEQTHDLQNGRTLPLDAQVEQLRLDVENGKTEIESLNLARQHPETGGVDSDDVEAAQEALADDQPDDDDDLADALRNADSDTQKTAARAAVIDNRLPKHSEELRGEVADALALSEPPTADELKDAGFGDPRKVS